MIGLADITSRDWSLRLDRPGVPASGLGAAVEGLADVEQCIVIIVTTPLGTDPLRPQFGCDLLAFLDRPLPLIRARAVQAIAQAIARWEPRAVVTGVRVTAGADVATGHLQVTIAWRLDVQGRPTTALETIVTLPLLH